MPKSFRVSLAGLSCLVILVSYSARSESCEDESAHAIGERFRLEYPAASKKLERFYTNVTMSVRQASVRQRSSEGGFEFVDWVFRGNGGSFRRDNTKGDDLSATVSVYDPRLSFRVGRKSSSSEYSLLWIAELPSDDYLESVSTLRSQSLACAAPFCTLVGQRIVDLILEKSFVIIDANRVANPSGDLLKIDWKSPLPDGRARWGIFVFAPDECWALKQMTLNGEILVVGTGKTVKFGSGMDVDYLDKNDGVPLVHQVRTWSIGDAGKSPRFILDVKSVRPGAAPAADFTPEAFGIRMDPAPVPVSIAPTLFTLSALVGVLAVLLIQFKRRSALRAQRA